MPFGLCNVPTPFQRIINTILRESLFVFVFLDYILIYGHTKEEHERHIRAVLERIRHEKFFGYLNKCDIFSNRGRIYWDLMGGAWCEAFIIKCESCGRLAYSFISKGHTSLFGACEVLHKIYWIF